jgi:hypothetical protein
VAGFTLLLLIVSGMIGMFVMDASLIVGGDAAATAHNLLAHERRFRVGILCGIVMLNCDIVLALALYGLLKPVNATLALLGAFWRVANAMVLGTGIAVSLGVLDLFGQPHYLAVFTTEQLQALGMLFLNMRGRDTTIELIFFSLGAGVHSYLLLKSGYIPKALSGLYLFATAEVLVCAVVLLVFPLAKSVLSPGYIMIDFVAELLAALWLAFKGARISPIPLNGARPTALSL